MNISVATKLTNTKLWLRILSCFFTLVLLGKVGVIFIAMKAIAKETVDFKEIKTNIPIGLYVDKETE